MCRCACQDTELSEYMRIPNTKALSERLRSCLQEHDPLPKDFQKLFNDTLFKFDTDVIPEVRDKRELRLEGEYDTFNC